MLHKLLLLVLFLTFCIACNDKENVSGRIEEIKNPAVVESEPAAAPEPAPAVTPPIVERNYKLHPGAGKVNLWKRSIGYDAAVFLPADYDDNPTKIYPMIISLHGLNGSVLNVDHTAVGGKKTGFIKQVWGTELANTYRAIVIAPDESPVGTTTTGLWDHSKLRQLILDAKEKYKVDPERIVATGLSAGSIATQQLVKYSKDLLAGAMPGAYSNSVVSSNPCLMADIPVWVFGNNSDSLFASTQWSSFDPKVRSCSNYIHEFTLTIYNSTCGHGCWDSHWSRKDVQEWLIQQRK